MELKELTEKTFELFGVEQADQLKNDVHPLILDFLSHWKQMIMYLNNEENRYLAEFRDALLSDIMSGKVKVNRNEIN